MPAERVHVRFGDAGADPPSGPRPETGISRDDDAVAAPASGLQGLGRIDRWNVAEMIEVLDGAQPHHADSATHRQWQTHP